MSARYFAVRVWVGGTLVIGQYSELPDSIVQDQDATPKGRGMEMLNFVHSMFEDLPVADFCGRVCCSGGIRRGGVKFVVDIGPPVMATRCCHALRNIPLVITRVTPRMP